MSILPILRGHRKPKQRFHPRPAGCTNEFTMLLMGERVTRNSGSWSTEEWSDGYYRKVVTEHSQSKLTIPQTSNMELPPYKSWLHSHLSQTLTNHLCKVANKQRHYIHTASPFLRGQGLPCSVLSNSALTWWILSLPTTQANLPLPAFSSIPPDYMLLGGDSCWLEP